MTLWAKLWTDILGDEKLMRAARRGAKQLVLLPWLLAFAKKAEDGGRLSVGAHAAEPEDIAHGIPGVTSKQVAAALVELEAAAVLVRDTDDVLRFANWDKRSGRGKPSDGHEAVRERVKRHRDNKKRADVTPGNAGGNALRETPCNETEIEIEKELDTETEGEPEARPSTPATDVVTNFSTAHDFGPFAGAVEGMLRASRNTTAVLATLDMHLAGELGHEIATARQLGLACQQFNANGKEFNPLYFGGFVKRAKAGISRLEVRAHNAAEDRFVESDKAAARQRDADESESWRVVTRFSLDRPDEYEKIRAAAEASVPATLTMGRPIIIGAEITTRVRQALNATKSHV